jgi:hypothetical protein
VKLVAWEFVSLDAVMEDPRWMNSITTRYAIIEAPSVLGLFPGGVERLPAALLDAGLADALGARRAGLVPPPPYDPVRDPETGLLNPTGGAERRGRP